MHPQSRQRLRALVLVALGGVFVALSIVVLRRFRTTTPTPAVAPVNGWAAQGVRFTHEGEHGARLRVAAAAVATTPVRMGVFSIGFLERVDARGVEVDVDLPTTKDPRDLRFDLRDALGKVAPPGAGSKRLVGGEIQALVLRVRGADAGALELRADQCDVRGKEGARLVLAGHVLVRSGAEVWTFDRLVYDVEARRFVAADDGAAPAGDALARANDALRRLIAGGG